MHVQVHLWCARAASEAPAPGDRHRTAPNSLSSTLVPSPPPQMSTTKVALTESFWSQCNCHAGHSLTSQPGSGPAPSVSKAKNINLQYRWQSMCQRGRVRVWGRGLPVERDAKPDGGSNQVTVILKCKVQCNHTAGVHTSPLIRIPLCVRCRTPCACTARCHGSSPGVQDLPRNPADNEGP